MIIPNAFGRAASGRRYCPAMRAPARGWGFLSAAMLSASAAGRFLDAGSLLPGVHETSTVRGGSAGWLTAIAAGLLVAAGASTRWSRRASLRSVAAVVVPGQLATFFAAEAVVRMANGLGPVDADGLVGASLQAALALLLLLAMTAAWVVALRAAALQLPAPLGPFPPCLRRTTSFWPSTPAAMLLARGPPTGACT